MFGPTVDEDCMKTNVGHAHMYFWSNLFGRVALVLAIGSASATMADTSVKAPIRDFTCSNAAPDDITTSTESECYETWKRRDGGLHYNFCIGLGATMRYFIVRLPNGQMQKAGHHCTHPLGGASWVTPNYYCPSGVSPVWGMCPDVQPELNPVPDPAKNLPPDKGCSRTDQGNPINAATGLKHQTEVDYKGLEGLSFKRIYTSVGADLNSPLAGPFGAIGWRLDWHRAVDGNALESRARVMRGKGVIYTYNLAGGVWGSDADITAKLTRQLDATGNLVGWTYFTDEGSVEQYSNDGKLMSVIDQTGRTTALIYSNGTALAPNGDVVLDPTGVPTGVALPPGLLLTIEDPSNRSLRLGYDAQYRVVRMTDPNGGVYRYGYDSRGNLVLVTYPDGTYKQYHYENATYVNALTGITDEKSVRFATWAYDGRGRAISSEHSGGADKVTLTYNPDGSVGIVDALGVVRSQNFQVTQGVARSAGLSQPGGSGCAAASSALSYDANGNVASEIDFNGHQVCYDYDHSLNLETKRVEGLGSTVVCSSALGAPPTPTATNPVRTVSTQWHSYWRLPAKIAQPLKLTTLVYNGDTYDGNLVTCAPAGGTVPSTAGGGATHPIGVLCQSIEENTDDATGSQGFGANRISSAMSPSTTNYTHDALGKVLTTTDPNNRLTTYNYYADTAFTGADPDAVGHTTGDLQSITNAAGHITSFTQYDKAGRVRQSIDAKGITTDTTYTPRGWVASTVVTPPGGPARTTRYSYDAAGQLKVVTQPDGSTVTYAYDPAHRLIGIKDTRGNEVAYTLDNAGNRTAEQIKDPSGVLQRSISRSFDALNRLQQVSGAAQ